MKRIQLPLLVMILVMTVTQVALAQQGRKPLSERYYQSPFKGDPSAIGSVMYRQYEHELLNNARAGIKDSNQNPAAENIDPSTVPRQIVVGGILYENDKEWIIWVNETRITPDAIPEEIISLRVTKDYVEMRWFDKLENKIYPVKIRPNQRFDLDLKLFLPG